MLQRVLGASVSVLGLRVVSHQVTSGGVRGYASVASLSSASSRGLMMSGLELLTVALANRSTSIKVGNRVWKRSIVGDVRTLDLLEGDYYSPEEQMAVVKKKRLLDLLDTSKDYAVQQKAYEDLLELQTSFRHLVCEPGFDIFGRPANATEENESKDDEEGSEEDSKKSKHEEEGEGAITSEWEAIQHIEDYKSVVDQVVFRETFKIGRHIKITTGGRIESHSAFVVIGTGKGAAAYGYGKAPTVNVALRKANADAEKNLVNVDFYYGRIPHDIDARFGGTTLRFYATRPGSGVVATELVRDLCTAFGLTDVSVKIHGNRNIVAIIKAFFKAMVSFVNPITSAKLRGEKVFDPRKIWRNGNPVFTYGQLNHLVNRTTFDIDELVEGEESMHFDEAELERELTKEEKELLGEEDFMKELERIEAQENDDDVFDDDLVVNAPKKNRRSGPRSSTKKTQKKSNSDSSSL